MKMPQSTIRYFAKSAYNHFQMTGRSNPITSRTVHMDKAGERVSITIELDVQNGLAYAMWQDGQSVIGQEMPIAKSWGF